MAWAPRLRSRIWRGLARGAWLTFGLWLGGAAAAEGPVSARYEGPTERYPHAVLGDAVEYTVLSITLADGTTQRTTLGAALVFEDLAPRLVDLTGDGIAEIITVESHQAQGARLSVWRATQKGLVRWVATPHIGTRFRWLAPIGAADLDGDGAIEIAYIDRPHLAKTLRIWRLETATGGARLVEVAAAAGFSNHRIGWDYIEGGLRTCDGPPEMIVATGNWGDVVAIRFDGAALRGTRLGPYSPEAIQRALNC